MFSMFSISLQYAVLAAGCATVAQGDSRPVLSGRFHLYCPSQCAAWAEEQVAPRVHHLQFPTSGPLELFNQWFVGRALAADVLSLSLATKGSRGATRDVAKAKLLTTKLVAVFEKKSLKRILGRLNGQRYLRRMGAA